MPQREERQVKLRTLLTAGLIAGVVLIWLVWWQWDNLCAGLCGPPDAALEEVAASDLEAQDQAGPVPTEWEQALAEARREWTDWTGAAPVWPEDLASPADCAAVEEDLLRLCARLDASGPSALAEIPGGSCSLIRQVAEELARRPPKLESELRSYQSILGNVFHLYRVLGAERVELLRELLREEREHAEPLAMALYRWMASRESCARSGRTPVRAAPLYDYAAFLFQTMGGQAYLRRRPPATEALAGFYALLILDQAVESGHNPHGVDPRPEIRRTRDLLEASPLVFGDRYRTMLDEMEQRWKGRDS
jgi:hypothetical protein